jgi:Phosphate-selective porin O and P
VPAAPAEASPAARPPLPPAPDPGPPESHAADEPTIGKAPAKKEGRDRRSDDDEGGAGVTFGLRLMAGFEHESEHSAGAQSPSEDTDYGFVIRQVRLSARGQLGEQFRASVSFELADALSPELGTDYDSPPYLRTATLEYRPSRAFRLRVGRFKRPFSQLELTSASDLPILRRGLFNGLALEDNEWGDRAVGAMASGRISAPKLRWYFSLTNPEWSANDNLRREGVDVTGRVEWRLVDGLVLGANAAYKNIENGDEHVSAVAFGGDLGLELGDAHILLESNSAPSMITDPTTPPRALGVLLMADYELPLNTVWSLQPTVFAEYADADADVYENESLRLVFALNLLGYDGFRVMPQVDLVRSIGDTGTDNPWLESTTLSLILSLVL